MVCFALTVLYWMHYYWIKWSILSGSAMLSFYPYDLTVVLVLLILLLTINQCNPALVSVETVECFGGMHVDRVQWECL